MKCELRITRKTEKPHLLREKKKDRARVLTALQQKIGGKGLIYVQQESKQKERRGKVVSTKMQKTVTVEVDRTFAHPEFDKVITAAKNIMLIAKVLM